MIFFDIFDALKHFHRENRHAWLTVISSISVLLFFDGTSGGAGFLVPLQGLESWRYWYGFGYPLASIFLLRGLFPENVCLILDMLILPVIAGDFETIFSLCSACTYGLPIFSLVYFSEQFGNVAEKLQRWTAAVDKE